MSAFRGRFSRAWHTVSRLAREARCCQFSSSPRRLKVTAVAASDIGKVRSHNEDCFHIESLGTDGALLLVADGMGGPAAGEVASAMAVGAISARVMDVWRRDDRPTPEVVSRGLREAMAIANGEIYAYASRDPQLKGMGTTATAVVLLGEHLCVGHIGDSRAYLVRAGRAERLTEDHSWVQHLLDTGALSPEEAASSPHRNVLLRALGPQPEVAVDVSAHHLRDGDVLMLCSDGLWSVVAEEEIVAVLRGEPNLRVACDTLIDLANTRGGRDNVTVLIARLDVEDRDSALEESTVLVVGG